jgi:hypothetical protein
MGQRAQQALINQRDLSPTTAAALASAGVNTTALTDRDIAERVETNLMFWRVVCLVASRAVTAPVKVDLTGELADPNDIDVLTNLLREWKAHFYNAQCSAEAYGEAFLAISTQREDGAKTTQNILRPNSVGRITLAPVTCRLTREGEYYYWPSNGIERSRKRVHQSRILHFVPRAKAGVVPEEGQQSNKSFIHRFAFALQLYNAGLATALTKMAQKEAIVASKKGLDSDVAVADEPEEYVKDTLAALVASLTQNGIALLDGKFDVTMLARSLTGMPEISANLRENLVAHSGLTDSLLFNGTAKGSNIAGAEDPDEIFLSASVDYLMETSWCPKFNWLLTLLRGAPPLVVRMQSSYQLSATALAKIQLDLARQAAILLTYQVVTPPEVRTMFEGQWSAYMQLDPNYLPPKVPLKVKAPAVKAALNKSNVQPSDRGAIDPGTEGIGSNKSSRVGDAADILLRLQDAYPDLTIESLKAMLEPTPSERMSDEALSDFIVGFGKSQPRLPTLKLVEERAIADGDCPATRVTGFCEFWRDGDGEDMQDADMDLIPERKHPVEVLMQDGLSWYWFSGRRTPILAGSVAAARKKLRRGGPGLVKSRAAKPSEYAGGKWFRGGPNGEAPGASKLRGFGPKPGG